MIQSFQTNDTSLKALLNQIETGTIQLPDFQRGWVWDDNRIRALIASVSLGYPVGALMSMETGGDSVRFSFKPFTGTEPSQKPQFLLLDGQQRMTSLFLALKSQAPVETCDDHKNALERFYYFDMTKYEDKYNRIDAIISVPKDKKIKKNFGRIIELDLSTHEKEFENSMFPLNIIFNNILYTKWILGYSTYYNGNKEKKQLLDSFMENVIDAFSYYQIPQIKLHKNTPKEAVCQVFENVNTGGVSLTVFELLTAIFATDNFKLREDWNNRREVFDKTDSVLNDLDETSFLTAVTLLASYRRHQALQTPVSCKRRDVLNLTLKEYTTCADALTEGLRNAAKFLRSERIFDTKNLPYQTQLIPLSVICACLGTRFGENAIRKLIRRWYWCGVLGELYGGANETRYALDVQNFMEWTEQGNEPVTIRDASFAPVRLLSMQTRNSAAYKGVISLMMHENCRDFLSGDTINDTVYFDDNIDIHHIFPKQYCIEQRYTDNKQLAWNSIVNKAPLSAHTNRVLGGKAPSLYLESIVKNKKIDAATLDKHLQSQFIAPEMLRTNNFQGFIIDRAKKLLDLIEEATGKRISGRDSEETVNAFGAPLL